MIHRALKLVRQFDEVSQFSLANKLQVDKQYIIDLESGKKPVSSEVIEKYSEIFDIPVSALIFFSESLHHKKKLKYSEKFKVAFCKKTLSLFEWVVNKSETKKKF